MARPRTLSPEMIVAAAVDIVQHEGGDRLTVRRLGEVLGTDPTSLYRHFRSMGDLERAVGDHFLAAVDVIPRAGEAWVDSIRRLCIELRAAQLAQPRLAALVRAAPPRLGNELAITEALLRELHRSGLGPAASAAAYHALIELTVGSAAIDAPVASLAPSDREAAYDEWRRDYAQLAVDRYPSAVQAAPHLYVGSADDRFRFALDALLAGLAVTSSTAVH